MFSYALILCFNFYFKFTHHESEYDVHIDLCRSEYIATRGVMLSLPVAYSYFFFIANIAFSLA